MLKRKIAPQPKELDWFTFSAGLIPGLCSDYIAVRLLYRLEPLTTAFTIVGKMLDVVEKSLKLYIAAQTRTTAALSDVAGRYGHNVEKLRVACAAYESAFDDDDVRAFTKDLNDADGKLYQKLRYGAQKTTDGFETNLAALMPVVDKIFCKSILTLPADCQKVLVFSSPLKQLLMGSRFDQTQNRAWVLEALRSGNAYFHELAALCHRLDEEHAAARISLNVDGDRD
jgi:hypothetical protein